MDVLFGQDTGLYVAGLLFHGLAKQLRSAWPDL